MRKNKTNENKFFVGAIAVIILVVGVFFVDWERLLGGKYYEFKKECAGEIIMCSKVPVCKEGNKTIVPGVFYGEAVTLGKIGGYFWNKRNLDDDIKEIEKSFIEYEKREAYENKKYLEKIKKCLKEL